MNKYLILILILAALLRFTALAVFPSGLNADEAALGYNAYSLLLTGKDEHGHLMPVNLESFGDFKPALYAYLLVPLVKVLGLTEFVVRLPSALFGVLCVFLIYVFVRQLMPNKSQAGSVSALFLAISPWHLHFSRGAWEVNVATTLILLGLVFFLRWLKSPRLPYLVAVMLSFSLSMYSYQSARVIAPILGLGLAACYFGTFWKNLKQSFLSLFMLVLFLTPFLVSIISSDAASRIGGVGLTADIGPVNFVQELRVQNIGPSSLVGKLLHNRPVIYSLQFIKNYLTHFEGNFLFVNGDVIERNRVPETGLLYFTDVILVAFGAAFLILNCSKYPKFRIVWLWLATAPIASALTFQVPHALRAQNLVVPMIVLTSAGLIQIIRVFTHPKIKFIVTLLLVVTYVWQFTRYLHQYYVHYPKTYPSAWEYGFKELVAYVAQNQSRYQKIIVTDKFDQPYSLFLFYLKYPPQQFQGNHKLTFRDKYNFSTVRDFDKYSFTNTSWDLVRDVHGSLIIAAAQDIPTVGVNIVKTINFPNGQPGFKIISN